MAECFGSCDSSLGLPECECCCRHCSEIFTLALLEYPPSLPGYPGPGFAAVPCQTPCSGIGPPRPCTPSEACSPSSSCYCGSAPNPENIIIYHVAPGSKLGTCCYRFKGTIGFTSVSHTEDCCEWLNSTGDYQAYWQPERFQECLGFPSCCGCDWCCDEVTAVECRAKKAYSWENLSIGKEQACIGNSCPSTPPLPVCRREEFVLGKRPAAHELPERRGTAHVGRHELHSLGPVRGIDQAPGVEECRTYYGHVGRGAPLAPTQRTVGWLCGQYNRNQSSTKRANRCYPSKRPDGRHSFHCAYRVPCPEKPEVCL